MSISTPLMTSSVIKRSIMPTSIEVSKKKLLEPDLGIYAKDVVEISKLGIENQQKETQMGTTKKIEDIASNGIRISSTIGRAHSVGNLTNSQATNLYNKIALLL
tara:strand:- start:2332 stop:2643 length:312 start_codon:yes stop_codon:yes gene_type:complete